MGQYHLTVNLSKREFLDPHKLGDGLKLVEQLNSKGGVMAALHILLACSNGRGGGDIEEPGRDSEETERYLVGSWAGDRIAVIGDYAEDGDLLPEDEASKIYDQCRRSEDRENRLAVLTSPDGSVSFGTYKDISDDIRPLVEKACNVKITGDGWRDKKSV